MIGYIRSGDSIDFSEWPCAHCGEKRPDHEWFPVRGTFVDGVLEIGAPYEDEGYFCADGEEYKDAG